MDFAIILHESWSLYENTIVISLHILSVRHFLNISYGPRKNMSAKIKNIIIYYFVFLFSQEKGTKLLGLQS